MPDIITLLLWHHTPAPTPTRVSAGGDQSDGAASLRNGGGSGAGSDGASSLSSPGTDSSATTAVAVAVGVISVALAGWLFRARQRARADYSMVGHDDQIRSDGSPDTISPISDKPRDTATYGAAPLSSNDDIRDIVVSSHADDAGDLSEDVV